ncbi:hypothetical protein CR513_41796, partial [Mucuna pruriens]
MRVTMYCIEETSIFVINNGYMERRFFGVGDWELHKIIVEWLWGPTSGYDMGGGPYGEQDPNNPFGRSPSSYAINTQTGAQ